MSEIARLMRNFRRLAADRRPNVSTMMTIRLPIKASTEVAEYSMTRQVRLVPSRISSVENRVGSTFMAELLPEVWFPFASPVMFIVFSHTGSMVRGECSTGLHRHETRQRQNQGK